MSELRFTDESDLIRIKQQKSLFAKVSGYEFRKKINRCTLPEKFKDGRLLKILFLDIIWVTIVWILIVYKITADSGSTFLRYYTNWGLMLNAFYYTLDLIFILQSTRWLEFNLLFIFFWQLTFNVWMIFVLVFPMLLSNPGTITDNFKQNGGTLDPGVVFVGDRIVHVVPVIMWFLYYYWRQIDFLAIYHLMYYESWANRLKMPYDWRNWMIIWYLVVMLFFNTGYFWTYYNAFDFDVVYEVSTPIWIGILILISIDMLIILSIIWLSPIYPHPTPDTSTWSKSPFDLAQIDITEYSNDMGKNYSD